MKIEFSGKSFYADLEIESVFWFSARCLLILTSFYEKCAFPLSKFLSLSRLWMKHFGCWTSWEVTSRWESLKFKMSLFVKSWHKNSWDKPEISSLRPNPWRPPKQSKIHKILDAVALILCTWWWFYTQFSLYFRSLFPDFKTSRAPLHV